MRSTWTVLTVVCLAAAVRGTAAARLAPASPPARTDRVRALGPAARALIDNGRRRSPSFAGLLQAIESSNLIVYVATGFLEIPGRLDFACAKAGTRFLRITVNVPDAEPRLIASLAHELQHAVEIASAPEVTDDAGVKQLYGKIGRPSKDGLRSFETKAAIDVRNQVLAELASPTLVPRQE